MIVSCCIQEIDSNEFSKLMTFSDSWVQYSFAGVQKFKIQDIFHQQSGTSTGSIIPFFGEPVYLHIYFFKHLNNCTSVLGGHRHV